MNSLSVSSRPRFRTEVGLGRLSQSAVECSLLIREQETLVAKGWLRRILNIPSLRPRDRDDLQLSSPTGVKLMEDRGAHAGYAHTPSQLPNEILRPGGTR
jgi:hypothetical protein